MSLHLRRFAAAVTALLVLAACEGAPTPGGEEIENPDAGGVEEVMPNQGREDIDEPDTENARGDDVNDLEDPGTLQQD